MISFLLQLLEVLLIMQVVCNMTNLEEGKSFISNNWKLLLGLALLLTLFSFGNVGYKEWKQYIIGQTQKTNKQTVVTLLPSCLSWRGGFLKIFGHLLLDLQVFKFYNYKRTYVLDGGVEYE